MRMTTLAAGALVAAMICTTPVASLAAQSAEAPAAAADTAPATPTTPAPQTAPAAPPSGNPSLQVVRAGDGAMTCEALIAEINTLNAQVQALQMQMTEIGNQMSRDSMAAMGAGRGVAGTGLGLASAVAGFIPGAGVLTGAAMGVAQQASQAAMVARQREIMERGASLNDSVTAMAPMANRAQHLSEISRNKGC